MDSGVFNNREIASIIWLVVAGIWVARQLRKNESPTLRPLLRSLRPLAPHFLLYGG